MSYELSRTCEHHALRARATAQLQGRRQTSPGSDTPHALSVLYDLASSPETAFKALALLHELQVHQVELEIQHEELQRVRTELEASLARHMQLYDAAPVGYLTLDQGVLHEVNRTAEAIFGRSREMLLGCTLESLLMPPAHAILRDMLDGLARTGVTTRGTLQIATSSTMPRVVHATASRDPAAPRFLLVVSETAG